MYILLTYDIGEKRVGKILKTCRKYLDWVQNSVFEGEIQQSTLQKMIAELNRKTLKEEDSIRIYKLRTKNDIEFQLIGIDKKNIENNGIL